VSIAFAILMPMQNDLLRRFLAAGLCTVLLAEPTLAAIPGEDFAGAPNFSLPGAIGQISESWGTVPGKNPDLILIQNLHVNRSVQFAISKILKSLKSQGLPTDQIAVEGATGPIPVGAMQRYPDARIRRKAADYLVQQGEMPGAVHFAVSEGEGGLFGIETAEYYQANLAMFRRSYAGRARLREEIAKIQRVLPNLKKDPASRGSAEQLEADLSAVSQLINNQVIEAELPALLRRATESIDRLKQVLPADRAAELTESLSGSVNFYALALLRNPQLFKNALAVRELAHQKTTIVITGGFHTRALAEGCRQRGLSYAVITPVVRLHDRIDETLYVERLLGHHLTPAQVQTGQDWATMQMLEPDFKVEQLGEPALAWASRPWGMRLGLMAAALSALGLSAPAKFQIPRPPEAVALTPATPVLQIAGITESQDTYMLSGLITANFINQTRGGRLLISIQPTQEGDSFQRFRATLWASQAGPGAERASLLIEGKRDAQGPWELTLSGKGIPEVDLEFARSMIQPYVEEGPSNDARFILPVSVLRELFRFPDVSTYLPVYFDTGKHVTLLQSHQPVEKLNSKKIPAAVTIRKLPDVPSTVPPSEATGSGGKTFIAAVSSLLLLAIPAVASADWLSLHPHSPFTWLDLARIIGFIGVIAAGTGVFGFYRGLRRGAYGDAQEKFSDVGFLALISLVSSLLMIVPPNRPVLGPRTRTGLTTGRAAPATPAAQTAERPKAAVTAPLETPAVHSVEPQAEPAPANSPATAEATGNPAAADAKGEIPALPPHAPATEPVVQAERFSEPPPPLLIEHKPAPMPETGLPDINLSRVDSYTARGVLRNGDTVYEFKNVNISDIKLLEAVAQWEGTGAAQHMTWRALPEGGKWTIPHLLDQRGNVYVLDLSALSADHVTLQASISGMQVANRQTVTLRKKGQGGFVLLGLLSTVALTNSLLIAVSVLGLTALVLTGVAALATWLLFWRQHRRASRVPAPEISKPSAPPYHLFALDKFLKAYANPNLLGFLAFVSNNGDWQILFLWREGSEKDQDMTLKDRVEATVEGIKVRDPFAIWLRPDGPPENYESLDRVISMYLARPGERPVSWSLSARDVRTESNLEQVIGNRIREKRPQPPDERRPPDNRGSRGPSHKLSLVLGILGSLASLASVFLVTQPSRPLTASVRPAEPPRLSVRESTIHREFLRPSRDNLSREIALYRELLEQDSPRSFLITARASAPGETINRVRISVIRPGESQLAAEIFGEETQPNQWDLCCGKPADFDTSVDIGTIVNFDEAGSPFGITFEIPAEILKRYAGMTLRVEAFDGRNWVLPRATLRSLKTKVTPTDPSQPLGSPSHPSPARQWTAPMAALSIALPGLGLAAPSPSDGIFWFGLASAAGVAAFAVTAILGFWTGKQNQAREDRARFDWVKKRLSHVTGAVRATPAVVAQLFAPARAWLNNRELARQLEAEAQREANQAVKFSA
jgi:hypothetical protein